MVINHERPKIGLALGSGGSRGMAHIGVIKALVENNIPLDYIAGTSIGALIGGLFAAFGSVNQLEELASDFHYRDLAKIFFDPNLSFTTLIRGNRASEYLLKLLGPIDISQLSLPFAAVATDVNSGKSIVLSKGSLVAAIRSSIAIPLVFSPVKLNQMSLVDGGTSEPVPVATVKKMGANLVIAVNLYENLFPRSSRIGLNQALDNILSSSVYLLLYHLSKVNAATADFIICPSGQGINPIDFVEAKKLIDVGYLSTLPLIKAIKAQLT